MSAATYAAHLDRIYAPATFARKLGYLRHNLGPHLRAGQRVLEIGPGRGELLALLQERNITDVDIIERDPELCRALNAQYRPTHLWNLDIEDLPTLRQHLRCYDVITMIQVLEHLRKETIAPLLQALYEHLAEGGVILAVVPNGGNPLCAVERYADLTHVQVFSEEALRQLVERAGLTDATVTVTGYRIPPVSALNVLRIAAQGLLHFVMRLVLLANAGNTSRWLHPNIVLCVRKPARHPEAG